MKLLSQFLFFLLLSLFSLCMVFYFFTTKDVLLLEMKKEDYFSQLSISIQEEMKNYINQSGFEERILENIFTENDVFQEIQKKVNGLEKSKIEVEFIEKKLRSNIQEYLHEKQLIAEEESLTKFVEQILQVYEEEIDLYHYFDMISQNMAKINRYLFSLTLLLFLSCFVMFCFFKKKKIFIPFLAVSFLLYFIVLYIQQYIDIEHILILHPVFSAFLKAYILKILTAVQIIAVLFFFVGSITLSLRIKKSI